MRLPVCAFALALLCPLAALAQPAPADPNAPAAAPGVPPAGTPMPPPPPPPMPPAPVVVAAPPPAPPAPPAKTWKDLLIVDALVDAYYQVNLTSGDSRTPTASPSPVIAVRSFDTNSNAFTLNYTKIGLGVNPEPVGLRIDIGYGATGLAVNGNGNPFLIQQAYATMAAGMLTLDFGKFMTTAGAEVIEANKNWNYSRSILFFNIPLVHTGVRATLKLSPELIAQVSIVNGWNGQGFEPDINAGKTFGVSINYTVPNGPNIIATGYFGKEFGSSDTRILGDLVVAHTIGDMGLNLNIDYITDKAASIDNWFGLAAMLRKPINDNLVLALRGEYAQNGGDLTKYKLYEGTVTAAIPMAGRYEIRVEARGDFSDQMIFNAQPMMISPSGFTLGMPDKKQQFTALLAFLAWF
ncbi:MAG TPA: outer membrane beta-barrel protein [Polyangia bacterium]|jgi:hypothetical protein|nr:outer membrane beta-barrel protein [Polyangia bacterium]